MTIIKAVATATVAALVFSVPAHGQQAATPLPVVKPRIQPALKAHGDLYAKQVYKLGKSVHVAVGWDLANIIMIEGDDGIVIVDTGLDLGRAREMLAEFRKITQKPVKAIVYTHHHVDHINGGKAFAAEEDVKAGRVRIIAHDSLMENVQRQGGTIGPILGVRSAYSFGAALGAADMEGMNGGIGPNVGHAVQGSFLAPTETFGDRLETTIAGIRMEMVHVPSEAPDEIAIWLPDQRVLLSAEVIQDHTFPNIHTLRGATYRDPVKWFKSIDRLRGFKADAMGLQHGPPVEGAAEVERVLTTYRDGIQFVHDQTVRYMNKGLTPEELAQVVKLPAHLGGTKPWMEEFYGTVSHSVRQIYQGYLGWFQGDPLKLDPIPPVESAKRHVALMGGRDKVMAAAREAYDKGDFQWAAELATYVIRIDQKDRDARALKANAFRELGYAQININWRNWYLMSALELAGDLDIEALQQGILQVFASPDTVAALPAANFVEGLTTRLKAEETLDTVMSIGWVFPDIDEAYGLTIRRGIAEYRKGLPENPDMTLTLNKTALDQVLLGRTGFPALMVKGDMKVSGNPLKLMTMFNAFEKPFVDPIRLTVR